ncbi:MAG: hypothetical protein ACLQBB_00870 [Solirubrobacteraceae bacterium]
MNRQPGRASLLALAEALPSPGRVDDLVGVILASGGLDDATEERLRGGLRRHFAAA